VEVVTMSKVSIVGLRGCKRSGFFAGLVGVIKESDVRGFEHLYRIVFENGAYTTNPYLKKCIGNKPCKTLFLLIEFI